MRADKIKELGFPEFKHSSQLCYLVSLLLKGFKINTYEARYIGIGNLHSNMSTLREKYKLTHSSKRARVIDPLTGCLTNQTVLVVWLSDEQREAYKTRKKAQNRKK
ncbi:hypothetical protein [Vibrio sp.]|uniref:hypothetical protein n=1 Tax=Vibrio sp. TaxID=678 RepID=UPI003D12671A